MQSYRGINKQRPFYLLLLFAAACAIGIVTMCYHEMWRDESQAFLLARDSKSLADLWQNVRYEGHPILWHFILYITYHLFPSIYTIQVVHMSIGLSVAALIVFYSPFTFFEKFLLCFSYFFSFEYLVISRNYSPGIFLLFLAVTTFYKAHSKNRILFSALLLGLSANSNIYMLIISCWLFIYFLSNSFPLLQRASYKRALFYSSILIFSLFLITALLQLIPPPDRTPKLTLAIGVGFNKTLRVSREISEAIFYFPNPFTNENYWGSSVYSGLFNHHGPKNLFLYVPLLLTLTLIILVLFSLKRSPSILLFFSASFASLFLFMYIVFDKGLLRHTGAFFVLLIATLWLYRSSHITTVKPSIYLDRLFKAMLLLQFAGSVIVHVKEIKYAFSGAKDAASFLVRSHRNKGSIILHPDFEGMALLHYAGIRQVYYCTIHGKGSFIRFNDKRKPCSYTHIYNIASKEHIQTMVFNGPKDDSLMNKIGYSLIYKPAAPSTVSDEVFYIYGRNSH